MGSYHGTGSITFRLYAPGVSPITGPAAYTEVVSTVNGDGTYHTTTGFVSNATGTWHWLATYTGDPNNHGAASGLLDEPVTIGAEADLAMSKVATPSQPILGQNVTYTLTVHNQGPDAATNVVVTDQFPSGVALVGPISLSQGVFNPATGVWSVGILPDGGSAILTVTGKVQVLGPITNTATAQADELDPDVADNSASVTVTGMRPPNMVSKLFFIDSFDPPAGDPAAALFTAGAESARVAAASSPTSLAGDMNGLNASVLSRSASLAALDGLFTSLGNDGTLGSSGSQAAGLPQFTQSGAASGLLGPVYGNTFGNPVDFTELTGRGQLLTSGGGTADVATDALASVVENPVTVRARSFDGADVDA
jgi:uncharacterized repeat protein (TIGR01451 family)